VYMPDNGKYIGSNLPTVFYNLRSALLASAAALDVLTDTVS